MATFGLIPWDYCKTNLEMDDRDKELTELLIFSTSAEIEIYTDRNLFEREIRELQDGYLQKEIIKLNICISGSKVNMNIKIRLLTLLLV
jgi:hypothetical protein